MQLASEKQNWYSHVLCNRLTCNPVKKEHFHISAQSCEKISKPFLLAWGTKRAAARCCQSHILN